MNPNTRRLSAHDRAVLPTAKRPHFLYRTSPLSLTPAAITTLGTALAAAMPEVRLDTAEIGSYNRTELTRMVPPSAVAAYDKLLSELGVTDYVTHYPAVLACRWALPHDDGTFAGKAFLSLVLHTGPEPYVMSMFATTGRRNRTVVDITRTLRTGDVFIFDPTVPHMAAPQGAARRSVARVAATRTRSKRTRGFSPNLKSLSAPSRGWKRAFGGVSLEGDPAPT